MALTKCKECGKEVNDTVGKCPHCGASLLSRNKIGWVVFFGIFILAGIIGMCMKDTTPMLKEANVPSSKESTTQQEIISITAEQLYKDYEANEIAADQKYKNKSIKVTGTVRVIGKTIGDAPFINLATGNYSHQVMVSFPAKVYDNELAKYSSGTQVEITGTCRGRTLGMVSISLR